MNEFNTAPMKVRDPITRTTKIVFAIIGAILALIFGASVTFNVLLGVGLSKHLSEETGLANANDRLLRQYCAVLNAYQTDAHKTYSGSTCEQAREDSTTVADAGSTGPIGPTGRGIKSISCESNGTLKVLYTDNTWSTITGSKCK